MPRLALYFSCRHKQGDGELETEFCSMHNFLRIDNTTWMTCSPREAASLRFERKVRLHSAGRDNG